MARRISESETNGSSRRRRRRWLLSLIVVAAAGLSLIPALQAVHDLGLFELDRNATNGAAAGEDWDTIYNAVVNGGVTLATAKSWKHDPDGATIFTGGGSKDDLDTTQWKWTAGSVPDKDEIEDGFAVRYGNILYFGADRSANNGDSQMGFWFFQNNVSPQPDGTFGPQAHMNGDVLVLSDFTKGGGTVTVRVFQWHSPGGAIDGTLDLIAGTTAQPQDCIGDPANNIPPVPNGDHFCGTVNAADAASPWPFTPKSGAVNIFHKGELYEGGIDLSFLNLGGECFASFLAETRSSQSTDAVLKDFVGGQFESCQSSTTTTPVDANGTAVTQITLGQNIFDHAVVTGTGSNTNPTGSVTFYICSPSQLTPDATTGTCADPNLDDNVHPGTLVSTNTLTPIASSNPPASETTSSAFIPDVVGRWCWRGEYSGDSNYPKSADASVGECFQVTQIQAHLATVQTWSVFDTATVTVAAGAGTVNGSVVFKLYNNSDCSGSAIFTSTKAINDTASPASVSSDTYPSSGGAASATYKWQITYAPSNRPAQIGVVGTCGNENTVLAVTNGVTEP